MAPSAAMRPAFLSALARPFLRSQSAALSTSPSFCMSAFLQSIIPAPETLRRADTSLAEIAILGFSSALGSSFFSSFFGGAAILVWAATSAAKSSCRFSKPSPKLNLSKRRTLMFSPVAAMASLTNSPTLLVVSLTKGCSRSAISFANLAIRPSTIFSRMFSGLDFRSSLPISISRSFAKNSGSTSSTDTAVTVGEAAICMAKSATSSLKTSPRATKSVSQFTSRMTPMREPIWMYCWTAPSAAMRLAFLPALAIPFFRSQSAAFSTLPSFSCNAFLQSIIPAPDCLRRAATSLAVIAAIATL
mmetsp:Transcript_71217/g.119109  ORF Transcript_71217/g.119109 Transcript_71217/m.119109 type:complete len:303 (-) Transcript_71217:498-1406(-)